MREGLSQDVRGQTVILIGISVEGNGCYTQEYTFSNVILAIRRKQILPENEVSKSQKHKTELKQKGRFIDARRVQTLLVKLPMSCPS